MNWTKLFDAHLEKLLPVRHVMREVGVPIEFGSGKRLWKADYTFSLAGNPFVVEVKLGQSDTPLNAMKVLAYQKVFNIHTNQCRSALVVVRNKNTNSADLMLCSLLKISLLTVDFDKRSDNSIHFKAKLDGSLIYHNIIGASSGETPLESQARGLLGAF